MGFQHSVDLEIFVSCYGKILSQVSFYSYGYKKLIYDQIFFHIFKRFCNKSNLLSSNLLSYF